MEKDAFYFPHFSNARHDRKIKRITKELGVEGYGIFFMILEVLREQTSLKYPMSDIDLLAYEFGTSEQKVRTVICNYGLFDVDQDEMFYSKKLFEYLKPYFTMKRQRKEAAESRWSKEREIKALKEPKEVQSDSESNTGLMRPHSDRITTEMQSKVKESKGKESKEKNKRAAPVSLEFREKDFKAEVAKFIDKYPKETLRAFFNHWSQPNQPKTKMRWEMEKTWDIGKRLANWKKNEDTNFGRNTTTYSQNGDSIEIEPGIEYIDKNIYKYPWHKNKKTQMWIKGHPYAATNQAEPQYADGMGRFITKEQFELLTKKEK